jgi:UDP-N-acetylmuramate dehydrogenase
MQQAITELQTAQIGEVAANVPMAACTTWKIGGPADLFLVPKGKRQLAEALRILHRHRIPWIVIGKGSNLLVSDRGVRGAVIRLGAGMDYVRFEGTRVYAGGCLSMPKLSALAAKRGLTGLEFASGIPGSVGGAVYMNAGAHGSDVSRILHQAEVMFGNGELATMQNGDLQYEYRHSVLHERPGIVTEAVFDLQNGDPAEIEARMRAYRERRVQTQPLNLACAGSVFRNPPGHYAAKLIEEAGLKGYRVGGAEVSPLHANFIINTGQATAKDVITLMEHVQETVFTKYGIRLVPEVLVVGER